MLHRIHWAFDPYSNVSETWERSLEAIQCLTTNNPSCQVIPTYFLGHELIHWINNMTPAQSEVLRPIVAKVMKSRLKEFSNLKFESPEIVTCDGFSIRNDTKVAAEYLESSKSDLVVLNTHARKGFQRLMVGSFAENLLLQSKTPLLFTSPNTSTIKSFDHVLYPTDFSKSGFGAFQEFLKLIKGFSKEITIYTKVISPISSFAEGATQALGGGWVSMNQYVEEVGEGRKKLASEWKNTAEMHGLKAHIHIDDMVGSFVDDLIKNIEEGPYDLVVAPSFSSQADVILIGSIARQIVRNSTKPVLIRRFEQ